MTSAQRMQPIFWWLTASVATALISLWLLLAGQHLLLWAILFGATALVAAPYYLVKLSTKGKQQIKFVMVCGLILLLPFQNTISLLIGFTLKPLTLAVPFLFFIDSLAYLLTSQKHKISLFEQATLLLMGWAVIYIPMTLFLPVKWSDALVGSFLGFLLQFQGVIYYFIVRSLELSARQTQWLLYAIFGGLFILVGYGIYEYIFDPYGLADYIVAHSRHPRIAYSAEGLYRHRTWGWSYRSMSFELEFVTFGYSGFVLSSICFALVLLAKSLRRQLWCWGAMLVAILGTLSSMTMSVFISLAIGCSITWLIWRERVKFFYLLILILASIAIAIFTSAYIPYVGERIQSVVTGTDKTSITHYNKGIRLFRDNLGDYLLIGQGTGVAGLYSSQRFFQNYPEIQVFEHEYVGNAAEWGWSGLLFYLFFMYTLLRHCWRLIPRFPRGSIRYALSVGLLNIVLGYILIGFIHNVWGQSSVDAQFMILLAMLVSADWSKVDSVQVNSVVNRASTSPVRVTASQAG